MILISGYGQSMACPVFREESGEELGDWRGILDISL